MYGVAFFCIFAPMKPSFGTETQWSENVIIADADYIDHVAFDLIVNFERMLMRRIPPADMARWAECIALDGGLRPQADGDNGQPMINLILIHDKDKTTLDNFCPTDYDREFNGKAFTGPLGEFSINSIAVNATTTKTQLLLEVVAMACSHKDVKRIMVIPNTEEGTAYDELRQLLRHCDDDKRVTLFAMQPLPGGNFRQEILGYSIMHALGIKGEELNV